MFTGIIESVGRIHSMQSIGGDLRLGVGFGALDTRSIVLGESIAVSGVCLTVIEFDTEHFVADVSSETLSLTTLGQRQVGDAVNLERAMRADSRFGGHVVAGHVDGIGHVLSISEDARSQRWRFSAAPALLRYLAVKGSITIDGVSLTVNAVDASGFEINLIPHTVAHTAFVDTAVGSTVNLEVDLIARYVKRLMASPD